MKKLIGSAVVVALALFLVAGCSSKSQPTPSPEAVQLEKDARQAYEKLCNTTPAAKELRKIAHAVLVFPSVVKGGFVFGGSYGKGVLFEKERAVRQYAAAGASFGLQAGAQSYGYALFFITPHALDYLDQSAGWEIGVGPTVAVLDQGAASAFSTTTAKSDIYAFTFGSQGLMAGVNLEGQKITRLQD